MIGVLHFVGLTLLAARRRIIGLSAFGAMFLAAAATARLLTGGEHGHVELDSLFALGGTTLVSALLLSGWLIGRFPLIAILVLAAGIFSDDRAAGYARLYAVRARSLSALYGARFLVCALLAFMLSSIVMPAFDLIVLGAWPAPDIFVLMAAQIIVFGSLTTLLSLISRADAWTALFLGLLALVWDALRRADVLGNAAPLVRDAVTVALPPQGALLRIESAFGAAQPVPWDAFAIICLYGTLALVLAGLALTRREL
jgi:hypothetical protein